MTKKRITIDPNIMVGKPVIKGTRIPVYLILNLLKMGYDFNRIIKAYPQLTKKDIVAAINYVENLTKYEEEFLPRLSYAV